MVWACSVDQTGGYFVKAPALRGVCLRERRGDDSATYIIPLGGLVYKERIASSTHFGIGTLPVSQRATVVRWTPRAEARPDCVSPASLRSAMRVSGRIATVVPAPARADAFGAASVHARRGAALLVADLAMNDGEAGGMAAGAGFDSMGGVSRPSAADASEEVVSCFHAYNVATRYTVVNNLYLGGRHG